MDLNELRERNKGNILLLVVMKRDGSEIIDYGIGYSVDDPDVAIARARELRGRGADVILLPCVSDDLIEHMFAVEEKAYIFRLFHGLDGD
ncbi:MAG: AroM family protein [Clostridiales bacterium]|nr:AroM family protein [Clostridiales bacterium]